MNEAAPTEDTPLAAGRFSVWLADMQRALRGEAGSDVPCDGCTACCTSSQFVHIDADEADTLAHIPAALLFPAPLQPTGNVVLGYDENGHCPMLIDNRCSIYAHRPRTCRTYDCRVFAATGVEPDDRDQRAIALRVRRWRFDFPDEVDRIQYEAAHAAAEAEGEQVPANTASSPTQRVVRAIRLVGGSAPGPDAAVVGD
jgi:Fe-S-cluster containining protein